MRNEKLNLEFVMWIVLAIFWPFLYYFSDLKKGPEHAYNALIQMYMWYVGFLLFFATCYAAYVLYGWWQRVIEWWNREKEYPNPYLKLGPIIDTTVYELKVSKYDPRNDIGIYVIDVEFTPSTSAQSQRLKRLNG